MIDFDDPYEHYFPIINDLNYERLTYYIDIKLGMEIHQGFIEFIEKLNTFKGVIKSLPDEILYRFLWDNSNNRLILYKPNKEQNKYYMKYDTSTLSISITTSWSGVKYVNLTRINSVISNVSNSYLLNDVIHKLDGYKLLVDNTLENIRSIDLRYK